MRKKACLLLYLAKLSVVVLDVSVLNDDLEVVVEHSVLRGGLLEKSTGSACSALWPVVADEDDEALLEWLPPPPPTAADFDKLDE